MQWWGELEVPACWTASTTVKPARSTGRPDNSTNQQDSSTGQLPRSTGQPALQLPASQEAQGAQGAQGGGEAPQVARGGGELHLLPASLTFVQPAPSQQHLLPIS